MKLSQKGVDRKVASEVAAEGGRAAEVEAARELCRRKKLGPYRVKADADPERKRKDIAVLARAGFRYDVIKEALASTPA
jgi:regulatory protein